MLSAPGLGTGLDIAGIVDQLVAAERAPAGNRLNLQETRANAELSAIGSLKSALSTFQGSLDVLSILDNFQKRKISVGDEDTRMIRDPNHSHARNASPSAEGEQQ